MTLALTGTVLGLAAAFVLTRSMGTLLFGVTPTDPVTFIVVPARSRARRARRQLPPGAARDEGRSGDGAAGGVS